MLLLFQKVLVIQVIHLVLWIFKMFGVAQELGSQTVDCVVTKKNVPSRGKVDVEKITHRESSSYLGRCPVTAGIISFLDTDPKIFEDSESFGPVAPYHHHIRDPLTDDSSHGFAEALDSYCSTR